MFVLQELGFPKAHFHGRLKKVQNHTESCPDANALQKTFRKEVECLQQQQIIVPLGIDNGAKALFLYPNQMALCASV